MKTYFVNSVNLYIRKQHIIDIALSTDLTSSPPREVNIWAVFQLAWLNHFMPEQYSFTVYAHSGYGIDSSTCCDESGSI